MFVNPILSQVWLWVQFLFSFVFNLRDFWPCIMEVSLSVHFGSCELLDLATISESSPFSLELYLAQRKLLKDFAEIKALDVTFTKWIFPFRYFYIAFNHTICFWLSDPEQFFSWSFYLSISWCKKMYWLIEQCSVERQQKRRTFTQIVTSYQAFVGHSFHRGLMVRFCLCEIPIPQEFSVWFYPRDLLTPIYKKIY